MRCERCRAMVHLPMTFRTPAAPPDLQTLFIYLFRRRKAPASDAILCSPDIKHQIQFPACAGRSQSNLRVRFPANPALRQILRKGSVRSGRGIFQWNTANEFGILSGRIKGQDILTRAFCALRRLQKDWAFRLCVTLQHRRNQA